MSDREFFESGDAEQQRRDAEDPGRAGMGYDPDPGQVDDEPLALVDQILMTVPERDPSRPLLYQLRRLLLEREIAFQEARRTLVELEGALEKVTAPANRVGIFLGSPKDGIANVWVGGSEYYANIDSRLDPSDLDVGARILINEAYAVVGTLGYPPGGPVVRIGDLLDEGRLRIGQEHGSSDTVLERSASLEDVDLKVGDEVRADPAMKVAIERLTSSESKEYFLEDIPLLPWTKIGGQEEAIQAIRDTIELPALHPELFEKFQYSTPKGFLLYGPPGCGKTLIGKATAFSLVQHLREEEGLEVKEYFMHIKGPEILNMWLGETERMVREIFSQARRKRSEGYLPFIFIDEAESILGTRRSMRSHHIANTVVPMFCTEMDGIESLQDVVIILASNRHDLIDPAILRPGRIDRKIKVSRPDMDSAKQILGIYLTDDLPIEAEAITEHGSEAAARDVFIEQTTVALFARTEETKFLEVSLRSGRTESLHFGDLASGALIDNIVQRAKEAAIKRAIADGQVEAAGLCLEDLLGAVRSEYRENEVFPPSDSVADWLTLLDYDPENVVRVAPVTASDEREPPVSTGTVI
ncbi:MAG TPA: AAA family ATPase [Candidatus Latescibacteria bacterium]|jgi:proteasome-associated ATPase|nr:peptidase [Gemmatimonadota bacterium]HCV25724.1 peptidase [Candidatus Latescibacterota bacterium]HJN30959.1 AAA family ATPase [Candidatus Latescibacterota bacterium]|tara:strand:+ start:919 stop:2670 length:1752 start_codon:yes stop_codon:yes gene_type:complete